MAGPEDGFQAPMELVHAMGFNGRHVHSLVFHPTDSTTDVIIYPIGKLLLFADVGDPHKQLILRGHDAEITCVDVSRSGRFVCSGQMAASYGDAMATLLVWDYATQSIIYAMREHKGTILSCSFSDDDHWVASAASDGKVCIWDMETGQLSGGCKETVSVGNRAMLKWLGWCPMENMNLRRPRYTLCIGYEKEVRVCCWEFNIKTMAFTLSQTTCQVPSSGGGLVRYYNSGCVSVDGQHCLVGTTSGDLIVYSIPNALFRSALPIAANVICCAAVDASTFIVGSGDGTLKKVVGREKDWRVVHGVALVGGVTNIAVSADRQEIVVGTNAGLMYRVLTTDLSSKVLMQSHTATVRGAAFPCRRSDIFITCGDDGFVRQWDLSDYSMTSYFSMNLNPNKINPAALPVSVCYIGDGCHVLSGWTDGFIRCLDLRYEQGSLAWQIVNAHKGPVSTIVSATQYFCSAGDDCAVRVWAQQNREQVLQIAEHKKPITGVVVDNTTEAIIHTFSLDKYLYTYELFKSEVQKSGKRLTYHCDTEGPGVCCGAQRSDKEHEMVVGTGDGRLLFYDIDYQQPTVVLTDSLRTRVNSIAISPSSRHIACGFADGRLAMYDLQQSPPQFLGQMRLHSADILHVIWSPDEKQLATCGHDCAICIWNFYGAPC